MKTKMKIKEDKTEKVISSLLSGRHPLITKFAGKHVIVAEDEVILLKGGDSGYRDYARLEKKYGHRPTITFVPKPGISYIL